MTQNNGYYKDFVTGYYETVTWDMDILRGIVLKQLRELGVSKTTKDYLQRRKWDCTNDYMLDNTDAMESYNRRNSKPNYKHMCAVLLEGEYKTA